MVFPPDTFFLLYVDRTLLSHRHAYVFGRFHFSLHIGRCLDFLMVGTVLNYRMDALPCCNRRPRHASS